MESEGVRVVTVKRKYPNVPAAFINNIANEGTKAEAVEWLQRTWNEACALRSELDEANNHLWQARHERDLYRKQRDDLRTELAWFIDWLESPVGSCAGRMAKARALLSALPPSRGSEGAGEGGAT